MSIITALDDSEIPEVEQGCSLDGIGGQHWECATNVLQMLLPFSDSGHGVTTSVRIAKCRVRDR